MRTPITITKRFGPYPAAHRQYTHDGHCALIHGHNWDFDIEFGVEYESQLDVNGFIVDFGKMQELKSALVDKFDHTILLAKSDPMLEDPHFEGMRKYMAVRLVDSPSAEGLSKLVHNMVERWLSVAGHAARGVVVVRVTCYEDNKNCATYRV